MKNPDNLEFKKRFDSVAHKFDEISNPYSRKRRSKAMQNNLNGCVLEVGSATGSITKGLAGTVVRSDISFEMCKVAKEKKYNVICCDAEMLPFNEQVFDGVIAAEIIYYLRRPENFISDCTKILKKEGKLLVSMPNPDMKITDKGRTLLRNLGVGRTYFDDGMKQFMKLEDLELLLEKYNFKIESIDKLIIFPFESFDIINRFLEKTVFNRFCIFIIVRATIINSK